MEGNMCVEDKGTTQGQEVPEEDIMAPGVSKGQSRLAGVCKAPNSGSFSLKPQKLIPLGTQRHIPSEHIAHDVDPTCADV